MAHVANIENKQQINVNCPDGFANQLRLALSGIFLKFYNYVESFNVEWSMNNHNNVNFLDYFAPLPKITFNAIDRSIISSNNIVTTSSFKSMIETLSKKEDKVNWEYALRICLPFLQPRKEIQNIVNNYVKENCIQNALGLHVRRTCKTAILKDNGDSCRLNNSMLSNEEILNLCSSYEAVFLATDNGETQRWFEKKLKGKLITFAEINGGEELFQQEYDRNLVSRHTTSLHTIMDFLILKNCKTFLGTSESSLSLLLKYWRNSPNDFPLIGRL
jgi:hypothetical protein